MRPGPPRRHAAAETSETPPATLPDALRPVGPMKWAMRIRGPSIVPWLRPHPGLARCSGVMNRSRTSSVPPFIR